MLTLQGLHPRHRFLRSHAGASSLPARSRPLPREGKQGASPLVENVTFLSNTPVVLQPCFGRLQKHKGSEIKGFLL